MALIKLHSGKAYVGKLENYLKDPEKTNESLQTGLNCDIEHLSYDFKDTKELHQNDGGRRYYHLVQSFHSDDNIDPKKAHEIGVELAKEEFGSKGYEVGIITHTDKEHTHNHIVINSVNAETGKKFKSKAKDLWQIKEKSNEQCKKYNLEHSLIDHSTRTTSYDRGEIESYKRGKSWKYDVIVDIHETLEHQPTSMNEFIERMEEKDYKIRYKEDSKTMTFETPEGKKVRGRTLGKSWENVDYSKGELENEIRLNREQAKGPELQWEEELNAITRAELRKFEKIQSRNANETREQRTETSPINKREYKQRDERTTDKSERDNEQSQDGQRNNDRKDDRNRKRNDFSHSR